MIRKLEDAKGMGPFTNLSEDTGGIEGADAICIRGTAHISFTDAYIIPPIRKGNEPS